MDDKPLSLQSKVGAFLESPAPKDPGWDHTPPRQAFVGTSGWAYPSWKPGFYPPKLPSSKFLEHYSTRLNTVEVNYTFRSLPSGRMLSNWMSATGSFFRFSFKAPQRITHMLRLKNCEDALVSFIASLETVISANLVGPLLFQLPPNFKADTALLQRFLILAGRSRQKLAFEFRNESWFNEDVYAVLRENNAALCAAESDDLATPTVRTADFSCFRFRKSDYPQDELAGVAAQLKSQLECDGGGDVFAYFKHEDEPSGPLRAEAVLKQLALAK